jgi:predicted HicB family RNase H-like nuclease
MSDLNPEKKRQRGRPPLDKPASKSLAGVRVTPEQLGEYQAASERAGRSMSAWVKSTLDKAAKRLKG